MSGQVPCLHCKTPRDALVCTWRELSISFCSLLEMLILTDPCQTTMREEKIVGWCSHSNKNRKYSLLQPHVSPTLSPCFQIPIKIRCWRLGGSEVRVDAPQSLPSPHSDSFKEAASQRSALLSHYCFLLQDHYQCSLTLTLDLCTTGAPPPCKPFFSFDSMHYHWTALFMGHYFYISYNISVRISGLFGFYSIEPVFDVICKSPLYLH